ncbi:MAG: hypothetical protein EZS28_037038 [Streblomastix strix]|uniref:Uncharacterized protein n=1 Tax=Streblomastix strix TaxID=222440 RepID=A0A5J4UCV8_9EUKA|nr:MAG: hypothetical protein EZS28_037038 [Streblomastix strix]
MLQPNQRESQSRIKKINRLNTPYRGITVEVKFRYIPGINNIDADSLSRLAVSGDNSIDKQILQQVLEEWYIQIIIDCFATRSNAKHTKYFQIENEALAKNQAWMEQSLEGETPLLHNPIALIPGVIYAKKLEQDLGVSQNILKEGTWMKKNSQKLSPGKIEIFFVYRERKVNNYSENAQQIQDLQDNQYKEQQMDGMDAGRETPILQQYLQNIGQLHQLSETIRVRCMYDPNRKFQFNIIRADEQINDFYKKQGNRITDKRAC